MLVVWGDDIRSTRMRIGCQYGDTTAGNILKGMGIYWVKGGTGVVGVWAPSRRGEGDWISTRRGVGRGRGLSY